MPGEARVIVAHLPDENPEFPLSRVHRSADEQPLSLAAILNLLGQHFACRRSGRLPALAVLAAFRAVADLVPIHGSKAADEQTGAGGAIEITLVNDRACTVYEIKQKLVTLDDLDRAIQKLAGRSQRIDNYVFITTDRIEPAVHDYAATLYEATGGTEFAVLDCLGFLRHFLHLFHRRRLAFLDAYQSAA
jgi:hypothetical protein